MAGVDAEVSALLYVHRQVIPAALELLPPVMRAPRARPLITAIGLQESRFLYRSQLGNGPARGFWQFELAGVRGVLKHPASIAEISEVLELLRYPHRTVAESHRAIENNDLLAAVYARLLLWTSPKQLPAIGEAEAAWALYYSCWRPGKPKRETWDAFYAQAWALEGAA